MKKIITFGNHTAELNVGKGVTVLSIDEPILPSKLADEIHAAHEDIFVQGCYLDGNAGCVKVLYKVAVSEFVEIVCEAISKTYDSDIIVSSVVEHVQQKRGGGFTNKSL